MKKYKSVELVKTVEDYIETEIGCNKCGVKAELKNDEDFQEWEKARFQEFNFSFGYGSRYDGERWSFDLCEECLTELIKTFKYVPDGFGEDNYIAHDPQLMFEHFKETGVVDLEYGMTPEEIEKRGGSIYVSDNEEDEE